MLFIVAAIAADTMGRVFDNVWTLKRVSLAHVFLFTLTLVMVFFSIVECTSILGHKGQKEVDVDLVVEQSLSFCAAAIATGLGAILLLDE